MNSPLEQHRERLAALCRRHGVRRLELFGSAARGQFDPATSDLDFLVLFHRDERAEPAERFLGLQEELEEMLGRKVDLVDVAAHRNPYFMAEALRNRVTLYAA